MRYTAVNVASTHTLKAVITADFIRKIIIKIIEDFNMSTTAIQRFPQVIQHPWTILLTPLTMGKQKQKENSYNKVSEDKEVEIKETDNRRFQHDNNSYPKVSTSYKTSVNYPTDIIANGEKETKEKEEH